MINMREDKAAPDFGKEKLISSMMATSRSQAYIRLVNADEIKNLFPSAPQVPANVKFYALFYGDGTPIMLTDNISTAKAAAFENELTLLNIH